jgi:hypothetical protein
VVVVVIPQSPLMLFPGQRLTTVLVPEDVEETMDLIYQMDQTDRLVATVLLVAQHLAALL